MTKIGIIAASCKPIHMGHQKLIVIAARENDVVKLFVSTSDRKRPGEVAISGAAMQRIWQKHVEPKLPVNVEVTYTPPGTPVGQAYAYLGAENEASSDDTYTIYSDPQDLAENFPTTNLQKYMNYLYNRRLVKLEPVARQETVDVSGTQMRQWLQNGDRDKFVQHAPDGIGEAMWDELKKDDLSVVPYPPPKPLKVPKSPKRR